MLPKLLRYYSTHQRQKDVQNKGREKTKNQQQATKWLESWKKRKKIRPNGNGATVGTTPHEIVMAYLIVISYLRP